MGEPTLKATGVWLPFLIFRICDTSVVNGPIRISPAPRTVADEPTLERQLLGIDLDRHGWWLWCYLELASRMVFGSLCKDVGT
jgi:hypothetical protein